MSRHIAHLQSSVVSNGQIIDLCQKNCLPYLEAAGGVLIFYQGSWFDSDIWSDFLSIYEPAHQTNMFVNDCYCDSSEEEEKEETFREWCRCGGYWIPEPEDEYRLGLTEEFQNRTQVIAALRVVGSNFPNHLEPYLDDIKRSRFGDMLIQELKKGFGQTR